MTPQEEARRGLVTSLRTASKRVEQRGESLLSVQLAQAANEIETLADMIDFRMADRISDAVVGAVVSVIKDDTGYEPRISPILTDNNSIEFSVDDLINKKVWHFQARREERAKFASFENTP